MKSGYDWFSHFSGKGGLVVHPLFLTAVVVVALSVGIPAFWSPEATDPQSFGAAPPTGSEQRHTFAAENRLRADEHSEPLSLEPRIGEIVPRAARNVTPSGVTPGPTITGPLVRIPSPVPRKPRRRPQPRKVRLFNPQVASAGIILTGDGPIRIMGVDAPQLEEHCGVGDQAWPCGVIARAQLTRLIRGRAIECQMPHGATQLPETTACSVAGQDLGDWLVRHGWAKTAGPRYLFQGKEAANAKRGLWGSGRHANSICISNC